MFSPILLLLLLSFVRAEEPSTSTTTTTTSPPTTTTVTDSSSSSPTTTATSNPCDSKDHQSCKKNLDALADLFKNKVYPERVALFCTTLKGCNEEQLKCSQETTDNLKFCNPPVSPQCADSLLKTRTNYGYNIIVTFITAEQLNSKDRCDRLDRLRHTFLDSAESEVYSVCGGEELVKFRGYVDNWKLAYKCN